MFSFFVFNNNLVLAKHVYCVYIVYKVYIHYSEEEYYLKELKEMLTLLRTEGKKWKMSLSYSMFINLLRDFR